MKRTSGHKPFLCSALIAGAVLAGTPGAAVAQANFTDEVPCGQTVPDRLASVGVDRGNVADYLTEENWTRGKDGGTFRGWMVWMNMKSCDGRVVVSLGPTCVVDTVYTTQQCRVDGVYHSG